jgi:hypothetical protein
MFLVNIEMTTLFSPRDLKFSRFVHSIRPAKNGKIFSTNKRENLSSLGQKRQGSKN